MVLYKAVESIDLDQCDGNENRNIGMNRHLILEDSFKLYRKLQKTRKCHRSVLDNQLFDVRMVEKECPLSVEIDSKEKIVRQVVCKMITL